MTERAISTVEVLNNELNKWERAKLAAALITLIGLSSLTSEIAAGVNTSSEQIQNAMEWAMIGTGAISAFGIAAAIEFSRKGDKTIRNALGLGIETRDRFFRRRLITPDQQAT